MKRWYRLAKARVRCRWYLLTVGMWNAECELLAWDRRRRLILVAACTGSISLGLETTKIFWNETPHDSVDNCLCDHCRGRHDGDSGMAGN